MASAIERRVFVVGVPRSGTTLVQSLLAAHGTVTSFTEGHLFDRHFSLLPPSSWAILTRDPVPRLRAFLAENGEEPPQAAAELEAAGRGLWRLRPLLPLRTRSVARRLLLVLDQLALRREATCWVEKTPRHLRYLPFLERLGGPGPRPHFVHVIRQGLEVVASLHRASRSWQRPYDLDTCARRWNRDLAFSLSRLDAPNDRFVVYEELAAWPEAVLERLLADLGLDWQPEILERYPAAASRLITDGEAVWKANVGGSIRPSATSGGELTEEQRGRVGRLLRNDLYDRLREAAGRAR